MKKKTSKAQRVGCDNPHTIGTNIEELAVCGVDCTARSIQRKQRKWEKISGAFGSLATTPLYTTYIKQKVCALPSTLYFTVAWCLV